MQEIIDPLGLIIVGFGLGEFIRMVRELEINTSGVNVDWEVKDSGGHRRTLDMPPRPARPEGRLPGRLILLAFLPEHEILLGPLVVGELRKGTFPLVEQVLVGTVARL